MNPARYGLYAAIVVGVGTITWLVTAPDQTTTPVETSQTAAPASTLALPPTTGPETTHPNDPTSLPQSDPPATAADTTVAASTSETASTTIQQGDERGYDGSEPDSIAVDFVVAAFADCWSCDGEQRQRHLLELAVPQVVETWPSMSLEERSVFTVRSVVIDHVETKTTGTIEITASITTDTDTAPETTETITLLVTVVDGMVVAASPADIDESVTATTDQ